MHFETNGDATVLFVDVVFAMLALIAWLAPTIVALVRRNTNLVWVAVVDILLAWTVVGWIVAWVLVFTGSRRPRGWAAHPGYPAYPMHVDYSRAGLSPDGLHWWDGTAWRSTAVAAPPHAPRSPDGRWWWDGVNWRPVPDAPAENPPQA